MTRLKLTLGATAAAVSALALSAMPAAASTCPTTSDPNIPNYAVCTEIGTSTADTSFTITSGTPYTPRIRAIFDGTVNPASSDGSGPAASNESFYYDYYFTIPQNGTGSGSLTTSFAADSVGLTVTNVIINGVSHSVTDSASGQGVVVGGIPITSGNLNTIDVEGYLDQGSYGADFTGNATFVASAPEPATWMLMIAGIGMVGMTMRRRQQALSLA